MTHVNKIFVKKNRIKKNFVNNIKYLKSERRIGSEITQKEVIQQESHQETQINEDQKEVILEISQKASHQEVAHQEQDQQKVLQEESCHDP